MKDRIKLARKELKLTQESFASGINVTRAFINMIESGTKFPSDRTIKDISRVYNVNEDWLRTGNGDMFVERTKKEAITDFFADVLNDEPDAFRFRLINALAQLPLEDWEVLANLCDKFANNKDE